MAEQQPRSLPQQAAPLAQQPSLVVASQQAFSLAQQARFFVQQSGLSSGALALVNISPRERNDPSMI
jgi:hypothetical protein